MPMKLPTCCKQEMGIKTESQRFIEAICQRCRDVVYVRKNTELRPQLIDD